MLLLKNAQVFAPQSLGHQDLLLGGGKILAMSANLNPKGLDLDVLDLNGLRLLPGFIDGHVHMAGAGGEGGPCTQTPPMHLGDFISAGVTSAVGCLGTDGHTRSIAALLMRARGLRQEGFSSWIYTGSYQVPTPTLTGDVAHDLCYVEEIIGAGEIAIADHRSSSPTCQALLALAKKVRLGGMLGGKAGILHLHMGDGPNPFALIYQAVAQSELSLKQFYPTHVNRNPYIFEDAKTFGKNAYVDITTSSYPFFPEEEIKPSCAVAALLRAGVPLAHITLTSDAGGSLPSFDAEGQLQRIEIGSCHSLRDNLADMVREQGLSLSQALQTITANPAHILKLRGKGQIRTGNDADLVAIDEGFQLHHVLMAGRRVVKQGQRLLRDTFQR